jgi:4-hydroxybenzoate polyprenyltransferase
MRCCPDISHVEIVGRRAMAMTSKPDTGASRRRAAPAVPLCVDLDGTLLKTDTLLEGILQLLHSNLLRGLSLLGWLLRGRAVLKAEVARHVDLDVAQLPVHEDFLRWLAQEKQQGRKIVLCTAAAESHARAIAARFGLFDAVLSSDATHNLSGRTKAARLVAEFGAGNFDYAGNAARDLSVWRAAHAAVVVSPTLPLAIQARRIPRVERIFARPAGRTRAWLRAARVHQWAKNVLVFVPAVAAHMIGEPRILAQSCVAFLAFCLAASGTYIINDLLDLSADRSHPAKRLRPFASGDLGAAEGIGAAAGLIGLSLAIGYVWLSGAFLVVLCGYILGTLWYSLELKRRPGADIFCLAALYAGRILGGSAATGIEPSFWLLAFAMFLFLSLAAAKRATELAGLESRSEQQAPGRGYTVSDLPLLLAFGVASAYTSVLVLALYVFSRAEVLYSRPKVLWLLCPVLLYWVSRVWLKTHRRQLHEDPVVFALTDRPSQLVGLVCIALVWLAD